MRRLLAALALVLLAGGAWADGSTIYIGGGGGGSGGTSNIPSPGPGSSNRGPVADSAGTVTWPQLATIPADSTGAALVEPLDQCATGTISGGGYNATTGLFQWTCGNYPWSAYRGSSTNYTNPIHAGGVAYNVTCTGSRTPDAACLANGEILRMNAMPDLMLAVDNTVPGGKVYMPAGIYVDRACGYPAYDSNGVPDYTTATFTDPALGAALTKTTDATFTVTGIDARSTYSAGKGIKLTGSATAYGIIITSTKPGADTIVTVDLDGSTVVPATIATAQTAASLGYHCPVLKNTNWFQSKAQTYAGIMIVGAGQDSDGPLKGGRTGSWWVQDQGKYGTFPYQDGITATQFNAQSGLLEGPIPCAAVNDAVGTYHCTLASSVAYGHERPITDWGRQSNLLEAATLGAQATVCLDNRKSTTGMCSLDHRVTCTADSDCDTAAGGAGLLGTCKGFVDSLSDEKTANETYLAFVVSHCTADDSTSCSGMGTSGALGRVDSFGAACATANGKLVQLGQVSTTYLAGFEQPVTDPAKTDTEAAFKIDMEHFNNTTGGWDGFNFMPNHWYDSTVTTSTCAGCQANAQGSNHRDFSESLGLKGAWQGGFSHFTFWYGSAGIDSNIDGGVTGFNSHYSDFIYAEGKQGVWSDMSEWVMERGLFIGNTSISSTGINLFTGLASIRDLTFVNNSTNGMFGLSNSAYGARIQNITARGNYESWGIFQICGAHQIRISGVNVQGNTGRIASICGFNYGAAGATPDTTDDVVIEDVDVSAEYVSGGGGNGGIGVNAFAITDLAGGTNGYLGHIRNILLDHIAIRTGEANLCGVWFDGVEAPAGSPRNIEAERAQVRVANFDISGTSGITSSKAICVGDVATAKNASTSGEILKSRFLPRLLNVRTDGVGMVDTDVPELAGASFPTCDGTTNLYRMGQVIRENDAVTEGTCNAPTGGGTTKALCKCTGGGGWANY